MLDLLLQRAVNLHQSGRFEEAARLYQDALRTDSADFDALTGLGVLCFQGGDHERAQGLIGEALKAMPKYAGALHLRGMALLHMRRANEALSCLDQALGMTPDAYDLIASRATALLELGRFEEALAGLDKALVFEPGNAILWNNRGNALANLSRQEEAVASFDKAVELNPDFKGARDNREIALFQLRRFDRMPASTARKLFDEFASHYDQTMLEKLQYRAHEHLRTLFDRVMPDAKGPFSIVDLGSGTGLVGEAFRDIAAGGRLDGIDLSPRMNETAKARGIYSDLILGDIETVLAEPGPAYDLALAADTMIYIGDVAPSFCGVAQCLNAGGLFIFAVEAKEGEDWEHTTALRFRHSEAYLRAEAARAGFEIVDLMECTLRNEHDTPVTGLAVALRKPA